MGLLDAAGQVAQITEIKGKAATGLRDFHRIDDRTALAARPAAARTGPRSCWRSPATRRCSATSEDEDDAERLANVEELVTAAKQFHDENPESTIADFLEQITLASDVDGWDEQADHVSVMTLHASKGLEFPVVYILGGRGGAAAARAEPGHDEDEIEEERRLCFVGMTRAMKELYLCHARLREFRGQLNYAIPSSFLQRVAARRGGVHRPVDGAQLSPAPRRTSGARRSARRRRTGPTPARGRSSRRRRPTELEADDPRRAGHRPRGRRAGAARGVRPRHGDRRDRASARCER